MDHRLCRANLPGICPTTETNRHFCNTLVLVAAIVSGLLLGGAGQIRAEEWPEWRGRGRLGVWNESGILNRFPEGGLKILWKAPVKSGFSGPAVAGGKVVVLDYEETPGTRLMDGTERAVCFDEQSGKVIWAQSWETSYRTLMASYATGPRATPTIDENRVYVVGASGALLCLDLDTGRPLWKKDYSKDFGTSIPTWGVASAPIVDGDLLISIVGGVPDAKVLAFNKLTGEEVWRALSSDWEMGYGQPVIVDSGGARQLIIWHPKAVSSLNPQTGAVYWEVPFEAPSGMTVATPVISGRYLLVSQFYTGSMLVELDQFQPQGRLVWQVGGSSEMPDRTEGLHALITTPVIEGDYVYGVCSYGQLRGLKLLSGERVWESLEMTELSRWAAAFLVRNGDRYFVNNDRGDLIIARFGPQGYQEIDRTRLIEPTSNSAWGSRRGQRRATDRIVNWSHPAYANRHIFARNDQEVLCASLEDR